MADDTKGYLTVSNFAISGFRVLITIFLGVGAWFCVLIYNKSDGAASKEELMRSSTALWGAVTKATDAATNLTAKQAELTTATAVLQANLTAHIQADAIQTQSIHEALQVLELARGKSSQPAKQQQ